MFAFDFKMIEMKAEAEKGEGSERREKKLSQYLKSFAEFLSELSLHRGFTLYVEYIGMFNVVRRRTSRVTLATTREERTHVAERGCKTL